MPRGLRAIAHTWFGFVLVGSIVGAVAAFGLTTISPPPYTARVTLLVAPVPRETGITNDDIQVVRELTPTFAELATTTPVLERVLLTTHIVSDTETLARSITTHVPASTSLLDISVSNADPVAAAALANALASQLRDYASPGPSDPVTGLHVDMTVVDPATPPISRDGPGLLIRTVLGAAVAMFLTIALAFLVENIWPLGRDPSEAAATEGPISGSPAVSQAPDSFSPGIGQPMGRNAKTIGTDPLRSRSTATGARIASRGVINELEIERNRRE
jgi:succinoglycan biosynthesis transport protein ExoP